MSQLGYLITAIMLFTSYAVSAENESLDPDPNIKKKVGERRLSFEEKMKLKEKRYEEEISQQQNIENDVSKQEKRKLSPIIHPYAIHYIVNKSPKGKIVEIEDGSSWEINPADVFKARNWLGSDPIVITQNRVWFSSFEYRFYNQVTGVSVEANLSLGPFLNNPYTRFIVAIDYDTGVVGLSDDTYWKISGYDRNLFNRWVLNDVIIIGANDSPWSWDDSILINFSTGNFAYASDL